MERVRYPLRRMPVTSPFIILLYVSISRKKQTKSWLLIHNHLLMPSPDPVIYLKKTLRSLWNKPRLNTLISSVKYYNDWREHLAPGRNSVNDKSPWMSFSAVQFLKEITTKDMRVFEYGSGGSTLFWITRVKETISVEHDTSWYSNMKNHPDTQAAQNFRYILAEPA